MKILGKKIAEIRKSKGLTQEELAESAKVNLRTIQRMEAEETTPRGNTLRAICEALEVNLEEIYDYGKKEDTNFLAYFHLSAISVMIIPMGNLIIPMILWLSKRDKVSSLYEQGVNLLNFQLLMVVISSASVFLGAFFKLEHSPLSGTFFKIFFMTYPIIVIYAIVVTLLIRKGRVRKYYPALLKIIK